LIEARGPYFAVMAADLQEPPELVIDFFRKLESDTCDVVCGVREGRDDPIATRATSALFWATYPRTRAARECRREAIDVFGCNQRAA
jgi:hypothetical protein